MLLLQPVRRDQLKLHVVDTEQPTTLARCSQRVVEDVKRHDARRFHAEHRCAGAGPAANFEHPPTAEIETFVEPPEKHSIRLRHASEQLEVELNAVLFLAEVALTAP